MLNYARKTRTLELMTFLNGLVFFAPVALLVRTRAGIALERDLVERAHLERLADQPLFLLLLHPRGEQGHGIVLRLVRAARGILVVEVALEVEILRHAEKAVDLAPVRRVAAFGQRIIFAQDFRDFSVFVFDASGAGD